MTANTAQSEAWNGDEGQYFVAQRARHERMGQQHTARLLATAAIGPAEVVLDVGCGCGETTNGAARPARSGRALGVDLSAVMLAEARRLAGREGVRNARFEQADAQVHAFPAAGFDVAISGFGVMFFADPHAAFANIAAALRPGGRLAFLCWQEMTANEWLTVPFAAVAAHVTLPELPAADEPGPFSLADPRHAGRCRVRPHRHRASGRGPVDGRRRRRRHRLQHRDAVRPAADRRQRRAHQGGGPQCDAPGAAPPPARRGRGAGVGRLAGHRRSVTHPWGPRVPGYAVAAPARPGSYPIPVMTARMCAR